MRKESSTKRKRRESSPVKKMDEVIYKLQNSGRNHSKELENVVQSWTKQKPDICIISQDRSRIFTQRILLSLYSKTLCSLLKDLPPFDLPAISVPASGKSIKNLLRLLKNGVTVSTNQDDLLEVEDAAKALNIELKDWNINYITVPQSQVLTYCRDPVVVKYKDIKPNVIDMANPTLEDLSILDDEIEIVETVIRVEDVNKSVEKEIRKAFPKTGEFETEEFKNRVKKMKESGTNFLKRRKSTAASVTSKTALNSSGIDSEFKFLVPKEEPIVDEFAPGGLLNSDGTSTQSESSVTLGERKAPKHRLFIEDSSSMLKELPETPKKNRVSVEDAESMNAYPRFYCGSCECGFSGISTPRRISDDGHSTGTPRTPKTPVQRELYNSCEACMKRKGDEAIKSIKQNKYFNMLKVKRLEAEKCKKEGLKFPCDKCDYVAAAPGNLKTHQMANHDGVQFMEKYVNDYFDKNKFLIL